MRSMMAAGGGGGGKRQVERERESDMEVEAVKMLLEKSSRVRFPLFEADEGAFNDLCLYWREEDEEGGDDDAE